MRGSEQSTSERAGSLAADVDGGGADGFFRTVVDGLADGVFAIDGTDTIVFANPGMESLLGFPPDQLAGEPLTTVVPERFSKYHALTDLLAERDVERLDGSTYDVPAVHSEGHRIWLSVSFTSLTRDGTELLLGTVRDSGKQREREAELAQYERIIETIDDGIYVLDEEFTITAVNEAVTAMTGYDRDELVGAHASLLASDDLLQQAAELSAEMLRSRRETATIVSNIVTKGGERVPIETRFSLYPFEDDSYGQLGVVRDISDRKQFEQTLRALHDSTRELLAVEDRTDVSRLIVDTATELLDLTGAVVYLVDGEETVLEPTAVSGPEAEDGDPFPALEPGTGLPWRVFVDGEQAAIDGSADELGIANGLCVPIGDHGVFVAATGESQPIDDDTETLVGLLAASAEEALSRLDREQEIRERDRRLEAQNRRLRQLDEVNGIIREIGQILVKAESVQEIGEAVCDRLAASDRFSFAWFGEPDAADGRIVPGTWSGEDPGYLDDVDLSLEGSREPATRALDSEDPVVLTDVGAELGEGSWRKAALSRGYQSVLGVPLTEGDITHGVLTVYADRANAFDGMEAVFAELAETIANAMNAVMTRRALLTENRTELGFRLTAEDDPLQRFARRAGGPITLEGVVPQDGGATRLFVVTEAVDPEHFCRIQEESVVVESVTLVADREESHLFEAVVTGPTVLTTIVDRGALVRTAEATPEALSLTVEVPDESDTRRFVEFVRSQYPGAELVSKTDRERPLRTSTEFQHELMARLTDRQMEVLRVAYHRGFYEWPRESTGQEVADSLGISQPTVNRHLRTCERKLFTMLFEEA